MWGWLVMLKRFYETSIKILLKRLNLSLSYYLEQLVIEETRRLPEKRKENQINSFITENFKKSFF